MPLLTPAALREECRAALGWDGPVACFPVRHHSPTCARHLHAWLHAFRPQQILIEGPAAFNDRIGILADPEHVAPFALVCATRAEGDVQVRSYYPFCDYSPELVALRVARELGATPRFIDLTLAEQAEGEPPAVERLAAEDRGLARSRFTRELIARSGCRNFEEVWESLFEQAGWECTPEQWALDVTAYAALSRRCYSEAELAAEGNLRREAHMAWHLAEAAKRGERIAVITGAFHTVALRTTRPQAPKKGGPAVEIYPAPYTFPRLDALLGYASGMAGPQFYQSVWEAREQPDPFAHAARQALVEATRLARGDGEVLGTADAIAALAMARSLADFRGRPQVGRVEVIEAATSCFIKGDAGLVGQRLLRALGEVLRGTRVGRLGPSAGQSPLVLDFHKRCKELRLVLQHGRPEVKELAIFQSDLDLARSRFFNQCVFLETGLCEQVKGPNLATGEHLQLIKEQWSVQYQPEVEARLLELAHLGPSVEDVAAALLVQAWQAAARHSGELARLLIRGLAMGLHRHTARLLPQLAAAMFADDDVVSLLDAGSLLHTVLRGRERLGAASVEGLVPLARQAFVQATLRLERLGQLGEDRIPGVLGALGTLLEVAQADPELTPPRELLVAHALAARDAARLKVPAVLGALDGILLQLGELPLTILAATLRSLGQGATRVDGVGGYLEGVLAVARHALLGEEGLLEALLEQIREAEWQPFLASLPSLRRALTRLTPRETEQVARQAAAHLGLSPADAQRLFVASPEQVARLGRWEQERQAAEAAWAGSDPS